jgi:hypothetical protein
VTEPSDRCAQLHARLRKLKGRLVTRSWEYRQRHCAKGVWPKLCRLLADAERAYEISEDDLTTLVAEGHVVEAIGSDLHPSKAILIVSPDRAATLQSRRPIPLHLTSPLLCAQRLVLVRFS